jgi:histone H3/H4
VREGLNEIRRIVETLVARRDERRDSFAAVIRKAMQQRLGSDADEVSKALSAERIPRHLVNDAMEIARQQGGFTIFALVDALTQLSQKVNFAGDRAELDVKIGQLLALAA